MTALKKSIMKFGLVEPIVVNKDMTVIAGHQRLRAWEELGKKEPVPSVIIDVSKKEEKALNLALNKISGTWDVAKLYEVINELRTEDELEFTGFDEKEVSKILDSMIDESEKIDEIPEYVPAIAKRGDIYKLGDHRLMCGDSTSMEDISKLIGENIMDGVFTDPPYNVNYESSKDKLGKIKNDNMSPEEFQIFIDKVFQNLFQISKPGATMYICSGWQSFSAFQQALEINKIHLSEVIVWVKNRGGIATIDYPHKHEQIIKARKLGVPKKKKGEIILYGWKKGERYYNPHGDYDVWEIDRLDASEYVHPTEKPDWLVMKALKNSTKVGENVIDLFGGSGSTLMACEKLGRKAFINELDPRFVDTIIARWENYTKRKAEKV
jgi:DNA modification methylase